MENVKLVEASLMALGWMCAKSNLDDPIIINLAKALKASECESTYVDEIINCAQAPHD